MPTCFVPGCNTGYLSTIKRNKELGKKNFSLFKAPKLIKELEIIYKSNPETGVELLVETALKIKYTVARLYDAIWEHFLKITVVDEKKMGSEHSTQQGNNQPLKQLHPSKSSADTDTNDGSDNSRPGSISPGPSICSDSDLPYISYTVNRPIGDSPKLPQKHGNQLQRGKSVGSGNGPFSKKNSFVSRRQLSVASKSLTHNIVVVKPALKKEPEKDPDLIRLQNVPMFLPIMRGTLNLPAVRDPEVLERLDPGGFLGLCLRYQQHLAVCADVVGSEQTQLGCQIRDVDFELSRLLLVMTERQKKFAKYAEKLGKVHEISHQLNKCHMHLNQILESMETLNDYLPVEDRLEPFIWTTG